MHMKKSLNYPLNCIVVWLLSFLVELVVLVSLCYGSLSFVSFPHVSEDDQRSLILARSWSHPSFDFHITVQVCNITSG